MTRPPSRRHVRLHVQARLNALHLDVRTALARWSNVFNTIRVPIADRDDGRAQRPRLPWEYPEDNAADWRALRREIDHMIEALEELGTYAGEQLDRFHCTTCEREIPGDEVRAGFTTCEHCPRSTRKAAS